MSDEVERFDRFVTAVREFRDERDWAQFHDPKSLILALTASLRTRTDRPAISARCHHHMSTIRELREASGLSQRDLARLTGIAQPNIAAYEAGRRPTTTAVLERVRAATRLRPSVALDGHRDEVLRLVREHKGLAVHVFGSLARGSDTVDSDLDLLVEFDEDATLLDLSALELALGKTLGVSVDVVSAGALSGRFGERVRSEMVSVA